MQFFLFTKDLNTKIGDFVNDEQATCNYIQEKVDILLDSPSLIANAAVRVAKDGIQSTVKIILSGISDSLIAAENVFIFFIEFSYGTYLCLIQLAIDGILDAVADVGEEIGTAVNDTLHAIADEIEDTVSSLNEVFQSAEDSLEKVASWLGEDINLPNVSIPEIQSLRNFTLSSSYDTEFEKLKAGVNFDSAINATKAAISKPFSSARNLILEKVSNYSFDTSMVSSPNKTHVVVCSTDDLTAISSFILSSIYKIRKVVIISLLIIIAGLFLISSIYEIWKWCRIRHKAFLLDEHIRSNKFEDTRDLISYIESPISWNLKYFISALPLPCFLSVQLRWFITYIFHPPAAMILFISCTSFISGILQLVLLNNIREDGSVISALAQNSFHKVESALANVSVAWANSTNQIILKNQENINNNMFGSIHNTTLSLNSTLNTFMNELNSSMTSAFGDTFLASTVQNVMNCLLYRKIENFEEVLTWVYNKSHIELPLLPTDILSKSIDNQTIYSSLYSSLNSSNSTVSFSGIFDRVEKSVISELNFSFLFFLLWLLICAFGLIGVLSSWLKSLFLSLLDLVIPNPKENITLPVQSLAFPVTKSCRPPPIPPRESHVYDFQNFQYEEDDCIDYKRSLGLISLSSDLAIDIPISPAIISDIQFNSITTESEETTYLLKEKQDRY